MLADVLEEDEKEQLAADYTLSDVYDADQYRDKVEVLYEYDMGDGWEHDILFLGKESASLRNAISVPAERFQEAICLGGEVRIHCSSYQLSGFLFQNTEWQRDSDARI